MIYLMNYYAHPSTLAILTARLYFLDDRYGDAGTWDRSGYEIDHYKKPNLIQRQRKKKKQIQETRAESNC